MRTPLSLRTWGLLACWLGVAVPAATLGADASSWLVSDELLEHAQLTRLWQTAVPVKEGERLDTMTVLGGRLYVRSSQNYTWSLDREDGRLVFGQVVAHAGFPLLGWNAYEDTLISVIDNQVVEFDRDSGTRKRASELKWSAIAPPARNDRFFYVSAADRRIHALKAENMVQVFDVSARNESMITSVLADDDTVVFGTDAGNLVALTADGPRKRWQFDAAGAIAGPVVRDDRSFYFADKDTHVYRVDEISPSEASLVWKYQTEAILDRPPRVTNAVVYQYAMGRGLTAIDKRSGQALWSLPEGVDLLAESRGRAYVITKVNMLAVMANRAGKPLFRMNLTPVVKHAANVSDGRIYVADDLGRITCLQPVR